MWEKCAWCMSVKKGLDSWLNEMDYDALEEGKIVRRSKPTANNFSSETQVSRSFIKNPIFWDWSVSMKVNLLVIKLRVCDTSWIHHTDAKCKKRHGNDQECFQRFFIRSGTRLIAETHPFSWCAVGNRGCYKYSAWYVRYSVSCIWLCDRRFFLCFVSFQTERIIQTRLNLQTSVQKHLSDGGSIPPNSTKKIWRTWSDFFYANEVIWVGNLCYTYRVWNQLSRSLFQQEHF